MKYVIAKTETENVPCFHCYYRKVLLPRQTLPWELIGPDIRLSRQLSPSFLLVGIHSGVQQQRKKEGFSSYMSHCPLRSPPPRFRHKLKPDGALRWKRKNFKATFIALVCSSTLHVVVCGPNIKQKPLHTLHLIDFGCATRYRTFCRKEVLH